MLSKEEFLKQLAEIKPGYNMEFIGKAYDKAKEENPCNWPK